MSRISQLESELRLIFDARLLEYIKMLKSRIEDLEENIQK